METLKYLNTFGIEKLKSDLNIKVNEYTETEETLYVLNYCQIKSPKTDAITKECRSLVVSQDEATGNWYTVSRAFDRFFNLGENGVVPDLSKLNCAQKMDGSLLCIFNFKGEWLYRTRSVIMPESTMNDFGMNWKTFIEDLTASKELDYLKSYGNEEYTYIFEITGRDNRVVVNYKSYGAYHLATRNNLSGHYVEEVLPFNKPEVFSFESNESCLENVKALPNLEEGYVCYNSFGEPVCKVKSPAYLAAHRLRGDGLTLQSVFKLLRMNEQDEYLSIFPEDSQVFSEVESLLLKIKSEADKIFEDAQDLENQKDFAIKVKDSIYSALCFKARSTEQKPSEVFENLEDHNAFKYVKTLKENL